MFKDFYRTAALPQPPVGAAKPASMPSAAASEPETRGLTRDELRRIVLDIVG
ncbi:hypothetical protein GCM10009416_04010 [Craurococcus roseus]|uniref:Uncharacterized protein n=1 Tax=Craurococcus roseus TaxID=77585 RepID=A0ABP3PLV6_9PROT